MDTARQRADQKGRAAPGLTDYDRAVIDRVEDALADGVSLLNWWRRTQEADSYARRFELIRTFNQSDESFGFFDSAPISTGSIPVMGIVEDMLYDQPKRAAPRDIRDELREFVLHYFLRTSAFERPEAYSDGNQSEPRFFPSLSWCPTYEAQRGGFGFSQWYYKLRSSGEIGIFPEDQRSRIVDLRQIGDQYEWVVLKVRIYDFNFTIRPRGQESVQVVFPLREESYLVLSPEFVVNEDEPESDVLGRYGFGYAFIQDPDSSGPFAYGPGQFLASFQLIHFRIATDGQINLDLVFVANRPDQILRVRVPPLDWGLDVAERLSLGFATPVLRSLRQAADRLSRRLPAFDPVSTFVQLANLVTGGAAQRDYCISWEQLEKQALVQHFMQHYQMIVGSLLTWRQYADWRNRADLPEGVIEGRTT